MRVTKIILLFLSIAVMLAGFLLYVYIGTYIFPIAPHWITQLPPNPPKPKIKYGEFNFKMIYSIDGTTKEVSNTLVCEFRGFEVRTVGGRKKEFGQKI